MDSLFFHPKLVHLPLGLALALPLLAVAVALSVRSGALPWRAWALVVALQALLVAGAYTAMRAGHQEEERVEQMVGERVIHEHEEAAEAFLWAAAAVLALAAGAIVVPAGRASSGLLALAVAGSFVVAVLAYRAGQSGGRLVYQYGAASAYASTPSPPPGEADDSDR